MRAVTHHVSQEVLFDAAAGKIVVRSEATGTPTVDIAGMLMPGALAPADAAGKKFHIYAIDIHTVVGGKLVRADHAEDWKTAILQVRGIGAPPAAAAAAAAAAPAHTHTHGAHGIPADPRALVGPFYESLTSPTADVKALVESVTGARQGSSAESNCCCVELSCCRCLRVGGAQCPSGGRMRARRRARAATSSSGRRRASARSCPI